MQEISTAESVRVLRQLPGCAPAENPPVTAEDYALVRSVVGDPNEPLYGARKTPCPTCGGRGRLDMTGRAVPMSTYFVKRTSQPCARCAETGKVTLLSLNEIARKWSSSVKDFAEFVLDPGGVKRYRPSLYLDGRPELTALANAYDAVQTARGDERRVFRG